MNETIEKCKEVAPDRVTPEFTQWVKIICDLLDFYRIGSSLLVDIESDRKDYVQFENGSLLLLSLFEAKNEFNIDFDQICFLLIGSTIFGGIAE